MPVTTSSEDRYARAQSEREAHVQAVLTSPAPKKIVVAGPDTGKTYVFKKLLQGKQKTLTLTFVNSLVEDLSLELCGMSEVRTLHSYARSILSRANNTDTRIFPKLSHVIREDAKLLLNQDVDFDHLFHNRNDESEQVPFYKSRKDYYAHYGFSDIVFAVVKYWEKHQHKIPTYEQVLVDEFQDFNKLEMSLIDLLAQRSPVLLVGDDDQALYSHLKSATAGFIRERYASRDYAQFTLPYCSRCTSVIVDAANDVITATAQKGLLSGRISKAFRYFESPEKDRESNANPKIIYVRLFAKITPWFIQKKISETADELKKKFSVLVISPTRTQSAGIVRALRGRGLQNIESVARSDSAEPTLLDGLKLLLEDRRSNLGWRIVAQSILPDGDFLPLLEQTHVAEPKSFCDIIARAHKREVAKMLRLLRALRRGDGNGDDPDLLNRLLRSIGADRDKMASDFLRDELGSDSTQRADAAIRKLPIKATTIQSSKGLADDYVFITHFDDLYFIKDKDKANVTDHDVCSFLVALTRARKRVCLISSDPRATPTFLNWISPGRIEDLTVPTDQPEPEPPQ
jgi:superfamily I DNA/RNA helicase